MSFDWSNCCRDEQCPIEELHEAHAALPLLGRTPKACPWCLKSLINESGLTSGKCSCGWSREGGTIAGKAEAVPTPVLPEISPLPIVEPIPIRSPWLTCPACRKKGCDWCSDTGYVPRLRVAVIQKALDDA